MPDDLSELAPQIERVFVRMRGPVTARVSARFAERVMSAPETISLLGGDLKGQMGLVDPLGAVQSIINAILTGLVVQAGPVRAAGPGLVGHFAVKLFRNDLSEPLSSPEARFTSPERGFDIRWLEWLLTAGDAVINPQYHFRAGDFHRSRTGLGVMGKSGFWKVPAEFSGHVTDNWLTRAVEGFEGEVGAIVIKEFLRLSN